MPILVPLIEADVFALRPDFHAVSIHAQDMTNRRQDDAALATLSQACRLDAGPHWHDAHLESWREAYRLFGAKPQRTPCSAEALRRRVERDGTLVSVNAVVDIYNALSLQYAVPIGGENAMAYLGAPRLVRATGGEPFDTVQNGAPIVEQVLPGEVVWRDDRGVTCRRWNWRQGTRTRIECSTTEMWFVIERLEPMPVEALQEVADALVSHLLRLSPCARVTKSLLRA